MNRLFSTAKMPFRKVSHVIFDMDGLLLDTETLYTKATQNIFNPYGLTYTWEVKTTLMGLHREEVANRIVEVYDLPLTPDEYLVLAQEQIEELMPNCKLMPDTEGVYLNMVKDIVKMYNKPYPWEIRMRVLGRTEQKTAEIIVNDLNLPITVNEFRTIYTELGHQRLGNAPLMRGAEKLVRHLHEHNIPIALATSSSKESVAVKLKNHQELFSLFHHRVMGSSDSEVKHGKPSPDIFLVAAGRFPDAPHPNNCLVFEDAPNGVSAAVAAGMQVIMVPDQHVSTEQCQHATVVLKSLEEVELEHFGLPSLPF